MSELCSGVQNEEFPNIKEIYTVYTRQISDIFRRAFIGGINIFAIYLAQAPN